MAGNRALFETALKRGHDYAWQNQWDRALKEYQRAIAEFPDDLSARGNLALAHLRLKQWPDALREYSALAEKQPQDTFVQGQLAEIYAATGRTADASRTYFRLADLFEQQNQAGEAIKALQELTRLEPKNKTIYQRIAELSRAIGDTGAMVAAYLTLANLALEQNNMDEAIRLAEAATNLDPESREARDLLFRLRRIATEGQTTAAASAPPAPAKVVGTELSQTQVNEMFALANGYQERRQYAAAARIYESLVSSGVKRPDVVFNLGLLYQLGGQHQQAVDQFQVIAQDEEYAMSAYYSMGESQRALGNLPAAGIAYDNALRLINMQTIGKGEIEDLIQLYEAAASTYTALQNTSRAASLYTSLAGFLQSRKWNKERTDEIRRKAESLTEDSMRAKLMRLSGAEGGVDQDNAVGLVERSPEVLSGRLRESDTLRPITDYLRAPAPAEPDPPPAATPAPLRRLDEGSQSNVQSTSRLAESGLPAETRGGAIRSLRAEAATPPPNLEQAMAARASREAQNLSRTVNQMLIDLQGYGEQQAYYAAVDTAFEVIRLAPDYLPIHLKLGELYLGQGRTEDALTKFQTTLDLYLVRGEPQAAADIYQRILAYDGNNLGLRGRYAALLVDLSRKEDAAGQYMEMARIYTQLAQDERAAEEYRRARQLAPQNAAVRLAYADFLSSRERYSEAMGELRRVLEIEAGNTLAMVRLNTLLTIQGEETRWDALNEVLSRSERSAPDHEAAVGEYSRAAMRHFLPDFDYSLALLQRSASRDEAIASLERGIRQLPPLGTTLLDVLMRNLLGELYVAAGRGQEAARSLEQVRTLIEGDDAPLSPRPNYAFARLPLRANVYHSLAEAYSLSGDADSAVVYLEELKRMLPYDREVYTRLSDLYFRQGQLPKALTALNELVEHYKASFQTDKQIETLLQMTLLAPSNIAIRQRLSEIYLKRGLIDQGLNELDTLADLQQKSGMLKDAVRSLQQAAEIQWMMSKQQAAYDIYDRITRISPNDVEARQQLINLHIQAGRLGDAVKEQKAIARICMQQGNLQEAEAALHQVIGLAPEDTEAYYALGKLLTVKQEFGQAAKLYARLTRLNPADHQVPILQAEMTRRAAEKRAAQGGQPKSAPAIPPAVVASQPPSDQQAEAMSPDGASPPAPPLVEATADEASLLAETAPQASPLAVVEPAAEPAVVGEAKEAGAQ